MARKFEGNPGDLIEINRGAYQHWAVYIGENEVIHFTTDDCQSSGSSESLSSSNGKVKREKLADVVGTHRYQVNNLLHTRRQARDPSIIVEEACAMVDRELQYNVDTYNCEHFATEMRYGKAESLQFKGKPGDLIEINRGDYQHWAVYIGENEVVHFTTDVKEACNMVGSEPQYDVDNNNSWHFATKMRYGKAVSRQFNGKPGDLIEIFRGSFQHWAVYIGENKVIHFGTEGGGSSGLSVSLSSSDGNVLLENFASVVGNDHYQVNNLLDDSLKAREPSVIVKAALAMVGRKLQYDLVSYNCEHFATKMRYGVAESLQITKSLVFSTLAGISSLSAASSSSK